MQQTEQFYAKDRESWREWLQKNHATHKSIWLVYDKGTDRKLKWEDIVQESLCFGWIDSRPGKISETQSKIYISRRNPKSGWSKINKLHVEKLIAEGQMTEAGQRAIDIAKENGSWDKLNRSDSLELPEDLIQLLEQNPTAKSNFENFSPSSKKMILEWIYSAKRDATRQNRVNQTVELASRGLKAY